MKKLFTFLILAIGSYAVNAQTFDFKIRYDSASCKYQALAVANATANTARAFGATFTIVVPSGMDNSAVSGISTVNPGGTSSWGAVTPVYGSSGKDYYPISLTSGGSYPAVSSGGSIVLFSFDLDNTVCASDVRPWASGSDPAAISGNSVANSFQTLVPGTAFEKYAGNDASDASLTNPSIASLSPNCMSTTKGIDLSASLQGIASGSCGTLSFAWTGPNGFTATTQNITVPDAATSVGTYTATVTDNFGCETSGNLLLDSSNCFIAPVPVSMLYFTGNRVNGVNKLNWSTANEINNSHFILERRINDGPFEFLDEVRSLAPNGNSSSILTYLYDDPNVHLRGAKVYYKLTQVDFDGLSETFDPVVITIGEPTGINVYPNPASDKITVDGLNIETDHTIEVLDVLGKTIITQTTNTMDAELNVGMLSVGIYTVRVSNAQGVLTTIKVLVQQ